MGPGFHISASISGPEEGAGFLVGKAQALTSSFLRPGLRAACTDFPNGGDTDLEKV